MLGGGAGILVVIVIGILVLQSAMLPTGGRTSASVTTTPSANASFAVAYASPSASLPASTPTPLESPIDEEGGYLETPDLDVPTATPDATATPTAKPTPKPTATPRPTHTPAPASVGTLALVVRDASNGSERHLFPIRKGDSVEAVVELIAPDFDRSRCSLVQVLKPDDPAIAARDVALEPLATQTVDLFDGWNTFYATCYDAFGPVNVSLRAVAHDGQPEACKDFEFQRDDISVTSFDDLASGVVGTWVGCATTPWTPMYKVTFVLREDRTYSAKSGEGLDGQRMLALYYGTDKDSPLKRYALTDLQASGLGLGEIDVVFDSHSVVRDDLRNIRLMGDKLEFEMFHFGAGPITFRLNRVS